MRVFTFILLIQIILWSSSFAVPSVHFFPGSEIDKELISAKPSFARVFYQEKVKAALFWEKIKKDSLFNLAAENLAILNNVQAKEDVVYKGEPAKPKKAESIIELDKKKSNSEKKTIEVANNKNSKSLVNNKSPKKIKQAPIKSFKHKKKIVKAKKKKVLKLKPPRTNIQKAIARFNKRNFASHTKRKKVHRNISKLKKKKHYRKYRKRKITKRYKKKRYRKRIRSKYQRRLAKRHLKRKYKKRRVAHKTKRKYRRKSGNKRRTYKLKSPKKRLNKKLASLEKKKTIKKKVKKNAPKRIVVRKSDPKPFSKYKKKYYKEKKEASLYWLETKIKNHNYYQAKTNKKKEKKSFTEYSSQVMLQLINNKKEIAKQWDTIKKSHKPAKAISVN